MKKKIFPLNVLVLSFIVFTIASCKKDEVKLQFPKVTTFPVTDIAYQSATCGGSVSSEGTVITARGVCWSTHTSPTLRDSITLDGIGEGSFTSNLKSLKPDSTYYVRTYAINEKDTVYGSTMKFKTKHATFAVNTLIAINTKLTTTSCGGIVLATGSTVILSRGVCCSLSPYPTVDDNFAESTEINATFWANLSNLQSNKTYYVRAYATSYNAIIYGDNVIFKTRQTALDITDPQFTSLAATTATVSANITSATPGTIISHGVCWNTIGNPTTFDSKTDEGAGSNNYSTTMAGLLPGTTYYMRSYVTDNQSTVYGTTSIFRTNETNSIGAPSIVILSSTKSGSVITLHCKVVYQGSSVVTESGYYMSTRPNPSKTDYSSALTRPGSATDLDLILYTTIGYSTIYVRAFATNAAGTGYSDSFIYTAN